LKFQQNAMIEQACCLKNLRDGAERIVPGIHLSDGWLVPKFKEEGIF